MQLFFRISISLFLFVSGLVLAADDVQRFTPAIDGYGGAVNLPDAAEQLDPAREYKLVFNISLPARGGKGPAVGLDTAARFINLAALAGVPKENLHIVLAMHGQATPYALSNNAYQEKFAEANPSLELINKLADYGVEVFVCGQALAGFGYAHNEVADNIQIAAAALTVLANYQLDGYALMSY